MKQFAALVCLCIAGCEGLALDIKEANSNYCRRAISSTQSITAGDCAETVVQAPTPAPVMAQAQPGDPRAFMVKSGIWRP